MNCVRIIEIRQRPTKLRLMAVASYGSVVDSLLVSQSLCLVLLLFRSEEVLDLVAELIFFLEE